MQTTIYKDKIFFLISSIAVYLIIYFYFLPWKTDTMYGDDLYLYSAHAEQKGFLEKINMPSDFGKFRPVHGVAVHALIECFHTNTDYYYFFNVAIQTINTLMVAILVSLILKSLFLSILVALMFGLSRFALFNMTQLLNGGALEGLAISFFLVSLYFMIRVMKTGNVKYSTGSSVLWAILFANLSMYTHERYIVIIPFIILTILLYPTLRSLTKNKKIALTLIAIGSIFVNVLVKKIGYSMPFFMGTASQGMEFSLNTSFGFFLDALLSIFQVNQGPLFLIGIKFSGLPVISQGLIIVMIAGILAKLVYYFVNILKSDNAKKEARKAGLQMYLFLIVLFAFFLVPAVSTIRLEQRWLQASLVVFILMLSIFCYSPSPVRNICVVVLSLLFIQADCTYLRRGAENIYMVYSGEAATGFKEAVGGNIIRPHTKRIFIWEMQNDSNNNKALNWSLGGGYLFEIYGGQEKQIMFVDREREGIISTADSAFAQFDKKEDQVIFIDYKNQNEIIDITDRYLRDSLKSFNGYSTKTVVYNRDKLHITNKDIDIFHITGLYGDEGGASWTNGNVEISFLGDFIINDSVSVELNTYMPPVCKDVIPQVFIDATDGRELRPAMLTRKADRFTYKYQFDGGVTIDKIRVVSKTIKATPPDQRILSFPFISLSIDNSKVSMDK